MKKMIVEFHIDESEFQELMDKDDMTLEEAVNQELADGNLDLNEVFFSEIRIENIN